MNKKLLQFASVLLMTVCLCVNFIACGDDDDDVKKDGTEQDDAGPVRPVSGTENGYAWVDLGLPSGLKWATCNVGAANPWDYGDYFAWGETVGYGKADPSNAHNYAYTGNTSYVKIYYGVDTYKYYSGTSVSTVTKYNDQSSYGTVDNKRTLDLADDAAHVNMGSSWRMPTEAEQVELIANCYWEWVDNYNGKGVAGFIVYKVKDFADKGKAKLEDFDGNAGIYALDEYGNIASVDEIKTTKTTLVASYSLIDAHIFLPAAGRRERSDDNKDVGGHYWSSSLYRVPDMACSLKSQYYWVYGGDGGGCYRTRGLPVRAVCK